MDSRYFSIYDKKARIYGQLFPSHTPGTAERSVRELMANPETPMSKFPDDFALYEVCTFDDESGAILHQHEPPLLIVEASSLVSG